MLIYKNRPSIGVPGREWISEEMPIFSKNIVSSSERLHNQNICVAVIFVPIFAFFTERRNNNAEDEKKKVSKAAE